MHWKLTDFGIKEDQTSWYQEYVTKVHVSLYLIYIVHVSVT